LARARRTVGPGVAIAINATSEKAIKVLVCMGRGDWVRLGEAG
jgi:hypothetical protein